MGSVAASAQARDLDRVTRVALRIHLEEAILLDALHERCSSKAAMVALMQVLSNGQTGRILGELWADLD